AAADEGVGLGGVLCQRRDAAQVGEAELHQAAGTGAQLAVEEEVQLADGERALAGEDEAVRPGPAGREEGALVAEVGEAVEAEGGARFGGGLEDLDARDR